MARYLVVAHQTAESPELVSKLKELAGGDTQAEFVLVVPITPVEHLLTWTHGESAQVAQEKADAAKESLTQAGLNVIRASKGDQVPTSAIDDELLDHPNEYHAIIICTFPLGISRWLEIGTLTVAKDKYGIPVTHIVAERPKVSKA
jgi:hypothetical protein